MSPGFALIRVRGECLTLDELSCRVGAHPELVNRLVEVGLIDPIDASERPPRFEPAAAGRLRTILRLRHDLGVNLAGIAIILDLLERLETLERERRRASHPRRSGSG